MTEPQPQVHQPPFQLDEGKCRVALGDPDTPGFVLLTIALWALGPALFGDDEREVERLDISEVWSELNERFGTWVTEEGENKLNALMLALDSDGFYKDPEIFMAVCNALYDGDLGDLIGGIAEKPSVIEIMWATLEVELAREMEDEPPPFSDAVRALVDEALMREQEDHDADTQVVWSAYQDLLDKLREIGVPLSALRLFDAEYAEVQEVMEVPGADAIL